ncbi:MAG: 4Fe-4S binding protein [Oscillospiraceae bacterium]|nr:4Fe-4S binding protein [Oscillospiraceae bacterium]
MKQKNRLLAQLGFFVAQNPILNNFFTGKIYQGDFKAICSPGLNCYSCPAAVVSCPIGAAQLFFAGSRHSLSLYVTGFLLTTGVAFGRFICGFVCPMGLLQDLIYRIKTPKLILRFRFLRYLKYVVLAIFVVLLPLAAVSELSGLGAPWFCQYICPSGTIFGALPLLAVNSFLRQFLGALFMLKLSIAAVIVITAVFIYRIFCRVLCPLGAVYALLNTISIFHMRYEKDKCISCRRCSKTCRLMIDPTSQPNSPECIRCGACIGVCAQKALSFKAHRIQVNNQIET